MDVTYVTALVPDLGNKEARTTVGASPNRNYPAALPLRAAAGPAVGGRTCMLRRVLGTGAQGTGNNQPVALASGGLAIGQGQPGRRSGLPPLQLLARLSLPRTRVCKSALQALSSPGQRAQIQVPH